MRRVYCEFWLIVLAGKGFLGVSVSCGIDIICGCWANW